LKSANVLILTDDSEFARLLSSCWRAERHAPSITVLSGGLWAEQDIESYDLLVVGPLAHEQLQAIVSAASSRVALILCAPADAREIQQLRARYPRMVHVPLREDWTQTLVLVAAESLRRVQAGRDAQNAQVRAAQQERDAVLGRYMLEMKHSVNNALTSILGNAELLLLEPGQLSAESLYQIKTMHHMTLRIHEIMQRFSSLASEMRDAENASHAETQNVPAGASRRR